MDKQDDFELEKMLEKQLSRKVQLPDDHHFQKIQANVWEKLHKKNIKTVQKNRIFIWISAFSAAASVGLLLLFYFDGINQPSNLSSNAGLSNDVNQKVENKLQEPQQSKTEITLTKKISKSDAERWILQSESDVDQLMAILEDTKPLETFISNQLSREDLENYLLENEHDIYLP